MALAPPVSDQTHPLQQLRLLIIDDSREYMQLLRRMIAGALPDVEVTEYDAEQRGKPGDGFDWSIYDAVLIDHQLDGNCSGLEWLTEFRHQRGFPPAILMTADGNEYLAARAIKLGAFDYVRKQDITTERITRLLGEAIGGNLTDQQCDQTVIEGARAMPHAELLERLAARTVVHNAAAATDRGYRFVRLIGQGAYSRIYLAERAADDQTMVLKVLDVATIPDAQVIERFVREAEIVQVLDSPHVVRFYDYGLTQTYGYIAMEFFTRGDLKQRIERGVLPEDAVNYMRHIALGLEAIHARGVVHRDLKPANIMFRADDSLALGDFGIARRTDLASDLTNHGCVLGTPNYLSPEQAMGRDADTRADLYSAGVVFYELLTGTKPFRAETPSALVYQHVHAAIPVLPDAYGRFQPLINCLLAKKPEARCATAGELLAMLDAAEA